MGYDYPAHRASMRGLLCLVAFHIRRGRCLLILAKGFTRASIWRISKGKVPRFLYIYTNGGVWNQPPTKLIIMKKIFLLLLLASCQFAFSQEFVTCYICGGSGVSMCGGCFGTGSFMGYVCFSCYGTGRSVCGGCMGAGGTYVNSTPNVNQYQSNSSNSNNSSNHNHSGSDSHESRYGYKDCHICHGSGVCQTCNGDGLQDNPFGLPDDPCANCLRENGRRTGKCSTCQGTGQVYGLKY